MQCICKLTGTVLVKTTINTIYKSNIPKCIFKCDTLEEFSHTQIISMSTAKKKEKDSTMTNIRKIEQCMPVTKQFRAVKTEVFYL